MRTIYKMSWYEELSPCCYCGHRTTRRITNVIWQTFSGDRISVQSTYYIIQRHD